MENVENNNSDTSQGIGVSNASEVASSLRMDETTGQWSSPEASPEENTRVGSSSLPHPTIYSADETPSAVANMMCTDWDGRNILEGKTVLEPSAGLGALASVAHHYGSRVTCIELNHQRAKFLAQRWLTLQKNFLDVTPVQIGKFDAVLMCPPRNAIEHIVHACNFVKRGGFLVALVREDSIGLEVYAKNYKRLDIPFHYGGVPCFAGLIRFRLDTIGSWS